MPWPGYCAVVDSGLPIDIPGTEHEAGIRFPVMELAGDDLDVIAHPFDAAERVLAAVA